MIFRGPTLSLVMSLAFGALGTFQVAAASPSSDSSQTSPKSTEFSSEYLGVMDRPRPEYDAKGIPLGGFRLFPSLDLSAAFDDNVLRVPVAQSDYFVVVSPSVRLRSQWGVHFLEIYGRLDNYDYLTFGRLNLNDWNIGIDGRLDVSHAATLSTNIYYAKLHEALESPNTVGSQASPNRYEQSHVDIAGSYQPGRLGIAIGGLYDHYTWLPTPLLGGGDLDNADRNEVEYQTFARIFYDLSPGYSVFLKGSYDDRHFEHFFDRNGLHRSSVGYRFDGGSDFQVTHLLHGEVFVGYLEQRYSQSVPTPLPNLSGLDFGVQFDWFVTPLVAVHLNGERQISDVAISGTAASDDRILKLSADYEFRYNVIVQGYISYTNSKLFGSTRVDDCPGAGAGVKYLMNRYLSAELNYNYKRRSSNAVIVDFTDSSVNFGVTAHL